MSAINERVSDLIHSEIADFFAGVGSPGEPEIQNGDAQKQLSARIDAILQQYRAAAEPVCPKCGGTGMADSGGFQPWGEPILIECDCHAAPQVTSVPEQVPESLKDRLLTICDLVEDNDEYCQDIWNACRAAMLSNVTLTDEGESAAPAVQAEQQPVTDAEHVASVLEMIGSFEPDDIDSDSVDLRFELDGVDTGSDVSITEYATRGAAIIRQLSGNTEQVSQPTLPADYLQGHKDGCEWSALMAEANHPQTGDWLYDDPIELAKAIRKGPDMLPAEPGNSPSIPDGYALVPIKLTAENGAKGLLSGEFSETKFISCPECFGDDECETCDGSGRIEITVPVSWTTIKEIWAKGVEHFAAAPKQEAE